MIFYNLNTSNVKVKDLMIKSYIHMMMYLNTSNVKVKAFNDEISVSCDFHLNTSNVKVKAIVLAIPIDMLLTFKYI